MSNNQVKFKQVLIRITEQLNQKCEDMAINASRSENKNIQKNDIITDAIIEYAKRHWHKEGK